MVDFVLKGEVIAIKGRHRVEKAVIKQEGRKLEKKVDELKTDERGFILTDSAQRTTIEGIFAAGDITHVGLRLITVAAAHGAIASHYIYSHVKKPYWARETWPTKI